MPAATAPCTRSLKNGLDRQPPPSTEDPDREPIFHHNIRGAQYYRDVPPDRDADNDASEPTRTPNTGQ